MTTNISRRGTLALLGGGLLATQPGWAAPQRVATGRLVEGQSPMAATLPHTRYFEIESRLAGARYAVWVATPPLYEREPTRRYPAIYMPDGNSTAPVTIPRSRLLRSDPIAPIEPFIHVCVGYAGEDAPRLLAVRARDLLPPGEPLPGDIAALRAGMAATVQIGMLDQAGADLYLRYLQNPAGDRFLAFLVEELHPLLAREFRIADDGHGFWGYSYGGLFATYLAMRRTPVFKRIGVGSPGILPKLSKVFGLYEENLKTGKDFSGRSLHMTVNEREITAPTTYAPLVGAGTTEFITLAGSRPLSGLKFTSRIVAHESHATGGEASWFSFLRSAYAAGSTGG